MLNNVEDEDFNDEEMMATFAARLQAWTPAYGGGKKLTRSLTERSLQHTQTNYLEKAAFDPSCLQQNVEY